MDAETVLKELLALTDQPLALAEAELRTAQEKIEKLKAERFGLELALARHRGEPAPSRPSTDTPPAEPSADWQRLNRTEAALRGLQEAGKPVHRKVLRAELIAKGRNDSIEHLSAALAYLKRSGRVVNKGYGMWVLPEHDDRPEHPQTSEDPAEAGSSTLSLLPSERRTQDDSGHLDSHPAPVMEAL